MTWREAIVIRILLVVAKLLSQDASVRKEIESISTNIQFKARETEKVAA
jgi:hypothetical protein